MMRTRFERCIFFFLLVVVAVRTTAAPPSPRRVSRQGQPVTRTAGPYDHRPLAAAPCPGPPASRSFRILQSANASNAVGERAGGEAVRRRGSSLHNLAAPAGPWPFVAAADGHASQQATKVAVRRCRVAEALLGSTRLRWWG